MSDRPYQAGRDAGDMICVCCGNFSSSQICHPCTTSVATARIKELESAIKEMTERTAELLALWKESERLTLHPGMVSRKAAILDAWCSGEWPPKGDSNE